jgi:putative transposase
LEDRKPSSRLVWNKLPKDQQAAIIEQALEKPELSPRELAVTYTDEQSSFDCTTYRPQHFLNFFPLPQGQGSLRPVF